MKQVIVTVWICTECGNYYASSNAGDLLNTFNTDIKGDVTFPRARCPECGILRLPFKLLVPQNGQSDT